MTNRVDAAASPLPPCDPPLAGSAPFCVLVESVYPDLLTLIRGRLHRTFGTETPRLTNSPTAIAHQVLDRVREQRQTWQSKDHFYAILTRLTVRVIVDYQRQRLALKRGRGRQQPIDADLDAHALPAADHGGESSPVLDGVVASLSRLSVEYPRQGEVAGLHLIWSVPLPRIAKAIGISVPTAERDWRFAKAWLANDVHALVSQDDAC